MRLLARRHRVGQAAGYRPFSPSDSPWSETYSIMAERGALLLQPADRAGQHAVGVGDRVVVGVDERLALALLQHVGPHSGWKGLPSAASGASRPGRGQPIWCITSSRPRARRSAGSAAMRARPCSSASSRHSPSLLAAGAPSVAIALGTRAHAPAAGSVVQPQHGQPGTPRPRSSNSPGRVHARDVGLAAEVRDHGGHRAAVLSAAGADVAGAHHVELGQLRVGRVRSR